MKSTAIVAHSIVWLLISHAHAGTEDTILSLAAESNENTDALRALLNEGANPNAKTDDGESALHLACIWGGAEKISTLLRAGADPNARASTLETSLDMTPLTWCVFAGYENEVGVFLAQERTNVNLVVRREDGKCMTAMDIALKIGVERGGGTQSRLRAAGALTYDELKKDSTGLLTELLPPRGCLGSPE